MTNLDNIIDNLIDNINEVNDAEAIHNKKRLQLRCAIEKLDCTLRS